MDEIKKILEENGIPLVDSEKVTGKIRDAFFEHMQMMKLEKCNRVEVIDDIGREFVDWEKNNKVTISLQDNERTLKIFIKKKS